MYKKLHARVIKHSVHKIKCLVHGKLWSLHGLILYGLCGAFNIIAEIVKYLGLKGLVSHNITYLFVFRNTGVKRSRKSRSANVGNNLHIPIGSLMPILLFFLYVHAPTAVNFIRSSTRKNYGIF